MGLVLNFLVSGKHGTHHLCCERHAYRHFLRDVHVGIPEGLFPLTCLNFSQFGSGSLALAAFQLFLVFGSRF